MLSERILVFLFLLSFLSLDCATAFPSLVVRQGESVWPLPSAGDVVTGVGAFGATTLGVLGALGGWLLDSTGLVKPDPNAVPEGDQQSKPATTTQDDPNADFSETSQDSEAQSTPSTDIFVTGTPDSIPVQMPALTPGTNGATEQCSNDRNPNSDQAECGVATAQIIFTVDPARIALNLAIEEVLDDMHLPEGWEASRDRDDGAKFYAASLTQNQIKRLEAMIPDGGVRAIVPDGPVEFNEISTAPLLTQDQSIRSVLELQGRHLQRHDAVEVQRLVYNDLAFMSSAPYTGAPDYLDPPRYCYFSEAGQGITVYVVDSGAEPGHTEFTTHQAITDWIYGLRVSRTRTDRKEFPGHGGCAASKVAGARFGVAKRAHLVIVKVNAIKSSLINGFQKIVNDLARRKRLGQMIAGYTVVTCQMGWKKDSNLESEQELADVIRQLLTDYQIVVIVAAGNVENGEVPFSEINVMPALLASQFPSLITVGAVSPDDGSTLPFSMGGPSLRVSAPGIVECANSAPGAVSGFRQGTSFAAPMVAGLAAYFLSLDVVGDRLRSSNNIPLAVLQYIQKLAYVREHGTDMAVWNGLDVAKPNYGWVP